MNATITGVLLCTFGYFLGAVPFGLILSKSFGGVDPRTAGSGNIGFTNVLRVSGKKVGMLTLLGDFGKGWVVSWLASIISGQGSWAYAAGLCVVVGHIFPIYLGFHGGKGVATGLGTILGIEPLVGGIMIGAWLSAVALWRYSSAGALTAFMALPVLSVMLVKDWKFTVVSFGISGLIFFKHTGNIKRLWNGTETRIGLSSS